MAGHQARKAQQSPDPYWRVSYLDEVDSTNRYVRDAARGGALPGLVVRTGHQTQGRGRLGRTWQDNGCALLFSVLLDPRHLEVATRAVALAAADACEQLCGVRPSLKWPNDLLVGHRKLAGILAEADSDSNGVTALVVGCGLNIDSPAHPEAVGLADVGETTDPGRLLEALLPRLDHWLREGVAEAFRSRCVTVGSEVRAELVSGLQLTGTAIDVGDDGALSVRSENGEDRWVTTGDVHHLRSLRPL